MKNVTGYDLHRLAVGAFGSLGVIVSVCLKLWPTSPGAATVHVDDFEAAGAIARPLSILEFDGQVMVFLQGTEVEVKTQAERLRGKATVGLDWPSDPSGPWEWSLRVPPASTRDAIERLPEGWSYLAVHNVGEIRCASDSHQAAPDLRSWAETNGGNLVMTKGNPHLFDPWGAPPPGLELQRRLIVEFDPRRILNPGRLPGGL